MYKGEMSKEKILMQQLICNQDRAIQVPFLLESYTIICLLIKYIRLTNFSIIYNCRNLSMLSKVQKLE